MKSTIEGRPSFLSLEGFFGSPQKLTITKERRFLKELGSLSAEACGRVSVGTVPGPVPQHPRREVQLGQWELGMLQSPLHVRAPAGHTGEPSEPRVTNKSKALGIKGNNTLENVDRKRSAFCQNDDVCSHNW